MAKSDKEVNTEKYAGTGRVASAIGSATLWSIPGSIVSGLMSISLVKSAYEQMNYTPPRAFGRLAEEGMEAAAHQAPKLKGRGLAAVGGLVALGTMIYGAVSGWRKAAKGKEQFEALQDDKKAWKDEKESLVIENAMYRENTKKFTDMHHSRAEHGSHADAALHEKAHAEGHER